jgi:hypothetical protein
MIFKTFKYVIIGAINPSIKKALKKIFGDFMIEDKPIGEDKKIKKYIIFKKDRIKNIFMQTLWRSRMDYKTACRIWCKKYNTEHPFPTRSRKQIERPKKRAILETYGK